MRAVSLATGAVLRHVNRRDQYARLPNESLVAPVTPQVDILSPDTTLLARTADAFALPRQEQALRLIDLFFNDTGLLFPYVHEKYIRTRLNFARLKGTQQVSSHFLALLNAIFAMAAHIDHASEQELLNSRPDLDAETFFTRARLLLGKSQRPTVERGRSRHRYKSPVRQLTLNSSMSVVNVPISSRNSES